MNTFKKIYESFSRKEKLVFLTATGLVVISGAVLLGLFIQRSTIVVPAAGGQLAEGMVGQPAYVNPVLAATEVDRSLTRLLFSSLESLSEKIEPVEGGRIWRVRLKQGLNWSDGQKLTSDDVIFTIQKIQDQETKSPQAASWQGVSVARQSELELQFNLASPYPFFAENLHDLFVAPKHLFADIPPANWKLSEYNLRPVGSGPYVFSDFAKEANGYITAYSMLANPQFAGGKAYVSRIDVKFFNKGDDMVRAFNTGLIDSFGTYDPELMRKTDRAHATTRFPVPGYYAAFFNQSRNPALADPTVRRALSESVDRATLVREVFNGQARPAFGPLTLEAPTSSSREELIAALDEAGWNLVGEARIKGTKAATTTLAFELTVPQIPFLVKTADQLKETWRGMGIQVEIKELPADEISQNIIKNREYEAILFGNILHPSFDLYSFWHSNERFYPGLNLALYQNRQADQLIESVRRELDPEKTELELRELERTIVSDNPAVFLYSPDYVMISSKDLKGVEGDIVAESSDRFREAAEWYLRTARTLK